MKNENITKVLFNDVFSGNNDNRRESFLEGAAMVMAGENEFETLSRVDDLLGNQEMTEEQIDFVLINFNFFQEVLRKKEAHENIKLILKKV